METAPPANPEKDFVKTEDVTVIDTDEGEGFPNMDTTPPSDPQLDVSKEQLVTSNDPATSF